jgi:predicted dehydrogenase
MAEDAPIRIGILGIGRAGFGMHRKELVERTDLFTIAAACDEYEPWRERMTEELPECVVYSEMGELLGDESIELVSIATRSCDHFKHAMAALDAGKHVLLEKPACATYEEARRLFDHAEQTQANLWVRQNRRFDPDFLHVREIIESGLLGEIQEIKLSRTSFSRRDDWQTIIEYGGGQLLNWGPHVIDHGLQLLGAPQQPLKDLWTDLRLVAAVGDAEDHLKIVMKGASSCLVDLEISGGAAIGMPPYLVWGTRGALKCDGKRITLRYLDPEKPLERRTADEGVPGAGFGRAEELPWVEEEMDVAPANPIDFWTQVYKAVRGVEPFPVKNEEVLETMRVISQAKEGTPYEYRG